MPDDFDVKIEGAEEVGRALDKLAWAVTPRGMVQVLDDAGLILMRRASRSFRAEKAPEVTGDVGDSARAAGKSWEPLAASTKHARRKGRGRGRGAKILQDKGAAGLMGSISKDVNVSGASVAVGTALQYGLYHQAGTKPYKIVPKKAGGKLVFIGSSGELVFADEVDHPGLPARPFLGYDKSDIESILRMIITHLERAAG